MDENIKDDISVYTVLKQEHYKLNDFQIWHNVRVAFDKFKLKEKLEDSLKNKDNDYSKIKV